MSRPKRPDLQPTPAELAVLKILWDDPGLTVREVMERVNAGSAEPRAYTSVMSLLNVMTEKGLVTREPAGRAFVYTAAYRPRRVLGELLSDLLARAFEGRSTVLVEHLMSEAAPSDEELDEIARLIEEHRKRGRRRR